MIAAALSTPGSCQSRMQVHAAGSFSFFGRQEFRFCWQLPGV